MNQYSNFKSSKLVEQYNAEVGGSWKYINVHAELLSKDFCSNQTIQDHESPLHEFYEPLALIYKKSS